MSISSSSGGNKKKHRVEVDYWENEQYRPLQGGWSIPFQALAYHYSDVSGKIQFPAQDIDALDAILLPTGWSWEGEWKPDNVGKFGQVDAEGWSYSSSLESLYEGSINRSLRAERKVSNIFRRRRWTRDRVCSSEETFQVFNAKVAWIEHICSSMSEVVKKNAMNFSIFLQYKDRRRKQGDNLISPADESLRETVGMLKSLCRKLTLMKQFLIEKAAVENLYANKIESLSKKWINAGRDTLPSAATDTNIKTDESSNESSRSSFTFASGRTLSDVLSYDEGMLNDRDSQTSRTGFFFTVNKAHLSIADRMKEFSQSLATSLPQDIDSIIQDATDAINECIQEGGNLRSEFVRLFKQAEQSFNSFRTCHESFQEELLLDIEELTESVRHQCASSSTFAAKKEHEPASSGRFSIDMSSLSSASKRLSFSASDTPSSFIFVSPELIDSKITEVQDDPRSSFSRQSVTFTSMNNHSNKGSFSCSVASNPFLASDLWLSLQLYRLHVIAADSALLIYNAFCKSQLKRRAKIAVVLAEFLKSTLKIFSNEQFRIWQDSAAMLEAVGVSTNMVLVHSDVEESTVEDKLVDGELPLDLNSDESDLYVGSTRSGSSKNSSYEKNLNLIMIHAGNKEEKKNTDDIGNTISHSPFRPSVYKDSFDQEKSSHSPSLTSSENSQYNSPLSIFSENSKQLPIAMAGILRFAVILQTGGSRQTVAGIATIDHSELSVGLVFLTFNRVLHIVRPCEEYHRTVVDEFDEEEVFDFSSVDPKDILLSASMKNVYVSPVFIPKDGFRDAFEVVFPWKTIQHSPILSNPPNAVSSIVFVAANSIQVRNWMRKISNAFVDPNVDPPSEASRSEEEFAPTSEGISNEKNLLFVGDFVDNEVEEDAVSTTERLSSETRDEEILTSVLQD